MGNLTGVPFNYLTGRNGTCAPGVVGWPAIIGEFRAAAKGQGMSEAFLAVVIVTYRTRELVRRCLESVRNDLPVGRPTLTIVVDNGSGDGTSEMIQHLFPEVKLVSNPENLGPAVAYNQGLEAACARFVLLLNSDVQIPRGTLAPMVRYLEEHPGVDVVSGRLRNPDGTPQFTRTKVFGVESRSPRPFRITFVGTGFFMARAEAFAAVGLFDEFYYFSNEDLDWSERAIRMGLRMVCLPEVSVVHDGRAGARQNAGPILAELYRSNFYYFHKFYGPIVARTARAVMAWEIAARRHALVKRTRAAESAEEREACGRELAWLEEARDRLDSIASSEVLPRWSRPRDGVPRSSTETPTCWPDARHRHTTDRLPPRGPLGHEGRQSSPPGHLGPASEQGDDQEPRHRTPR
jgi:N-acetylglucosaminyl-diphospho-decaprenol L-rhamnosyltransferase